MRPWTNWAFEKLLLYCSVHSSAWAVTVQGVEVAVAVVAKLVDLLIRRIVMVRTVEVLSMVIQVVAVVLLIRALMIPK